MNPDTPAPPDERRTGVNRTTPGARASDRLVLRLLRFLPRNLISRGFGWLASRRRPRWFARRFMAWFANRFKIDLDQAERPIEEYRCLLELFTRRLRPGARPIANDPTSLVNPVDGKVGAFGRIDGDLLLQAKGMPYGLVALLGSEEAARPFLDGWYATLYLSPRDYHRIHSPTGGVLEQTLYEPGTLWPVNPPAVATIPQLFAVNERITSILGSELGPVAVVMVGATNVGSIRLAYQDFVTNRSGKRFVQQHSPPIPLGRGEHLATFELGSTVVLLVGNPGFRWQELSEGGWIPMGVSLGRVVQER